MQAQYRIGPDRSDLVDVRIINVGIQAEKALVDDLHLTHEVLWILCVCDITAQFSD